MKLDQKLFEQIVDLLQTHMSESGRQTLITLAFSAYDRLYSQIDQSGNSRDFSVKLIKQLIDYGQVTPDEEALVLLLKTLRTEVGYDVQAQIDEIIATLPFEPPTKQGHPMPKAARMPQWVALVMVGILLLSVFYGVRLLLPKVASTPTPTAMPTPAPTATLFPPRAEGEMLVLVADILIPGCAKNPACFDDDPDEVTQRLVSTMRKNLKSYPEIRIERLGQFIEEEGGSERAMEIGRSPEFDATFMIWGNYLEAPEVYLFFDIMNTELPFFGGSYDQAYGPTQIQQPSMFEFKASLGEQWAYVTAFATGLTLYQANNRHHEAEPLFDIAAQMLDGPENSAVDSEMIRHLYFYRGTNYLHLGRANLAEPDLTALYEILDPERLAQDELGAITLGNLGIAYLSLGEYEKAIEFYEEALAISREIKDRRNEGAHLGNLGSAYSDLGEYEKAIEFNEEALAISREIKDRSGEGAHLGNLGNTYRNLGEYEKAIDYLTESYAILNQIKSPAASLAHQLLGSAYNSACWRLSLNRELEVVLPYCEEAVKHDPQSPFVRDSRGLAYALLGETEKAIADFQFAVDGWKALENPAVTPFIEARQGWIDALAAGENPFTDEVLAALRDE